MSALDDDLGIALLFQYLSLAPIDTSQKKKDIEELKKRIRQLELKNEQLELKQYIEEEFRKLNDN